MSPVDIAEAELCEAIKQLVIARVNVTRVTLDTEALGSDVDEALKLHKRYQLAEASARTRLVKAYCEAEGFAENMLWG